MHRLSIAVLLLSLPAGAETIVLKNGRKILADSVRENGSKVEYTVGEDTYAISRASVARIDTGGSPVVTRPEPLPELRLDARSLAADPDLQSRLIRDGKLDTQLVGELSRSGQSELAAHANLIAAEHYQATGNLPEAVRFFEQAHFHLPTNPGIEIQLAMSLIRVHRYADGAKVAERALRREPTIGALRTVLGYAYYQLGRLEDAVKQLKLGVSYDPDERAQALLARVERELKTQGQFLEESSSHFVLKFEGGQAPPALRRTLLDVLERHYADLVRELDYVPRQAIQVILYTQKQFFDVTRAPQWTGALNDGKLRIPISGLETVDTRLSRVLRHELAHSFVNLASNGRAPTWLHEGIAQVVEPQSIAREGRRLAALYGSGHNIPLNQLEGSFQRFSEEEATVAYAQALAAAEYIRDVYGMSSLSLMLKRLAEGQSNESALRAAIHSGYAQFDRELALWLSQRF